MFVEGFVGLQGMSGYHLPLSGAPSARDTELPDSKCRLLPRAAVCQRV